MPASGLQRGVFRSVTFDISLEFGLPELHVGLWHSRNLTALVTMPEATVHEDDRVPLGKHNVGMAGKFGGMKAVAEPQSVEMTVHKHLRLRVLRPNPAHRVTALRWGDFVH